jgi:hypothetical protein
MAALIGGLFFVVSLLLNENFSTAYELFFSPTESVALYTILVGKVALVRSRPCGRNWDATVSVLQRVHCLSNRITAAERIACRQARINTCYDPTFILQQPVDLYV